jgi:CheY-like chemotaxis protein
MTKSPSLEPAAVLIVEDDDMIRMIAAEFLEEAGFRVLEAGNADEAVRTLAAGEPIAAVFTDINMPGAMDGLDLAHFVRNRWPTIKVLLTSGRWQLPVAELPSQSRFVLKPYRPDQIVGALRDMVRGFEGVGSSRAYCGGKPPAAHSKIL